MSAPADDAVADRDPPGDADRPDAPSDSDSDAEARRAKLKRRRAKLEARKRTHKAVGKTAQPKRGTAVLHLALLPLSADERARLMKCLI